MSILYFFLVLLACAACGIGGAFAMRFNIERKREIAEREDPRDTKIRDLQAKVRLAGNDMARHRSEAKSATEHVEFAHSRIVELLDRIKGLENSLQNQEAVQGVDHDEKELLREKLSVATRQLETQRQRNQELEVELSIVHEPDMLSAGDDEDEPEEPGDNPFVPPVPDSSPSLIQALTGELDRWKRHCHVLGDELKNQRHRVAEIDDVMANAQSATPQIDELTDIRGIGVVLARKLHKLGIYRYEDLLNLSADDLERACQLIPDFERRMKRDNWLEQARLLNAGQRSRRVEQVDCVSGS